MTPDRSMTEAEADALEARLDEFNKWWDAAARPRDRGEDDGA